MSQPIEQPLTHSLLRQSQRRRQSFSIIQPNSTPSKNFSHNHNNFSHRPQSTNKQKYHYNYSRSSNLSSHKKGISSSLYQSKYLSKQRDSPNLGLNNTYSNNLLKERQVNVKHSMIVPSTQEKVVVCQSLPKTRPKYSFTFTNLPPNQSVTQAFKTTQIMRHQDIQDQPNPQTPRVSLVSHENPNPSSQRQSFRSPNIRKDMDQCLYSISDKLKQLQEQQKQTKNFIQSKFNNPSDNSYRPSLSQIWKNKKMYLDKSIHRIHPEIVNEYIETVYRDYNIPDPLKSGERIKINEKGNSVSEITMFEIRQKKQQLDQRIRYGQQPKRQANGNKLVEGNKLQSQASIPAHKNENNPQNPLAIQAQPPKTIPHQLPEKPFRQQYYLQNVKFPQNQRKNNLISSHKNQQQLIKNRKKKFLDLTLSKQKPINPKTFNSPNQQAHKRSSRQQHSSHSQKSSHSKSKHSNSQKKIQQIKKNIATWNDHQHQYAERYSYLQSPYEMIRHSRPIQPTTNTDPNNGPINIRIRPFEQLMKATVPTQSNEHYSTKGQNTTQHSQLLESKYVQSFFTQEGQVMEEFRFCILCELPVLSANISRHQDKCIGWVDHKGKLVNFRDLYGMDNQEELKQVIKGKIMEIRKRMTQKIIQLKEREKIDPHQTSKLTANIIQSVQNLVESFIMMTDFDQRTPHNTLLFSSGYKKIQQNYKSQYILLLEQSKKLHWFVKLLENYQRRVEKLNITNQAIINEKGFTSTKAKHNQSLTFIEEEQSQNNQVISEFGSQRQQQ